MVYQMQEPSKQYTTMTALKLDKLDQGRSQSASEMDMLFADLK